jgi:hypothetical protein
MNGQLANNRAGFLNQSSGEPVELSNEFAAVTLSLDYSGRGPRLHVTDTESGEGVYLDPLLLSALCRSTPADRQSWLRTGDYGDHPAVGNGAHGDHE